MIAAVVAVGLLLVGLVTTGVIPLAKSSSEPAFAPTFQGAVNEGQSTANAAHGGPWGAALGIALRIPLSITVPTGNITQSLPSISGCNATLDSHLPTDVVVQGTPASAGPGASAFWIVLYVNSSGGTVGLMVDGGTSMNLFTLGGTACSTLLKGLAAFPAGSPDSPTIVDAVNASGGSTFLADHPGATQVFLGASIILLEPTWIVVFTSCAITPLGNSSGEEFNASVIGTTVENVTSGPVSCSLPTGTGLPTLTGPFSAPSPIGKAI